MVNGTIGRVLDFRQETDDDKIASDEEGIHALTEGDFGMASGNFHVCLVSATRELILQYQ